MNQGFHLAMVLLLALSVAAGAAPEAWPAGYHRYTRDPSVDSPDGTYGFIVPTNEAYDKGERCKIVNLKTGAPVHTIAHGEYWNEGDGGLSNGGINARWRADPAHAGAWRCVIEFEGKWQPRNLTLVELDPTGKSVESDIWGPLEKAAAQHFHGKVPDKAFNEYYAMLLTEPQIKLEDAVVIEATADSNPKDDAQTDRYTCPVTARFDIGTKTLQFTPGKLELRKGTPEK